jgi:hypothetical protein
MDEAMHPDADDERSIADVTKDDGHSIRNQIARVTCAKTEVKPLNESYVPVNFIPDEALAMIAAWESLNLTASYHSDQMDIDESVLENHVETALPYATVLPYTLSAPPKRYFRTFWRSISRKILESTNIHQK